MLRSIPAVQTALSFRGEVTEKRLDGLIGRTFVEMRMRERLISGGQVFSVEQLFKTEARGATTRHRGEL